VTWGGVEGVLAGLLFSPTPCDVILGPLLEFHHHPQMQIASFAKETLANFIKTKHPTKGEKKKEQRERERNDPRPSPSLSQKKPNTKWVTKGQKEQIMSRTKPLYN